MGLICLPFILGFGINYGVKQANADEYLNSNFNTTNTCQTILYNSFTQYGNQCCKEKLNKDTNKTEPVDCCLK